MGPNFTHFGERVQGVARGYEGAGRCINSSNRMECCKTFTGAGIITQCTAKKKPELDHASP